MQATRTRYWVVVFALALAMIMYIQRVAISQAIVPISADLHLDKRQTGLVLGAFGLSYALFEIPMGLLGDKLGVRWVLSQLVLIWSAFTALTGAVWNLASLWAIRFLFGAGEVHVDDGGVLVGWLVGGLQGGQRGVEPCGRRLFEIDIAIDAVGHSGRAKGRQAFVEPLPGRAELSIGAVAEREHGKA